MHIIISVIIFFITQIYIMNNQGGSKNSTIIGDGYVKNGDFSIDKDLIVSGDMIIEGGTTYNGDVTINTPNCLIGDCIQEQNLNSFELKNSAGASVASVGNIDNLQIASTLELDEARTKTGAGNMSFNASDNTPIVRLDNDAWLRASDIRAFTGDGTTQISNQAQTSNIKVLGAGGVRVNDSYTFPTSDGTASQIIKTDGSGNLTFEDDGGTTTLIGSVSDLNDFSNNTGTQSCIEYVNGTKIIQISSMGIGTVFRCVIGGVMELREIAGGAGLFEILYRFRLTGGGASSNVEEYVLSTSSTSFGSQASGGIGNYSNVKIMASIIRVDTNSFQPFIQAFGSDYRTSGSIIGNMQPIIPVSQITGFPLFAMNGDPDTSTIDFDVRYTNNISAGTWSTKFLAYSASWGIEQLGSVNPPVLTQDDHNLLNNLTVGDVHTQYTKLSGRSGGQILSGGLTSLNNLTLKSHSIGLDNVIVKNLVTEFKKNIDMDSNNITSVSNVTFLNNANFNGSILTTDNNIFQLDAGTAFPKFDLVGGGGMNLNNGFIYDCASLYGGANITLGCDTGSVLLKTGAFPSQITRLDINDTRLQSTVNLDMNNNNIINCTEISANSGAGIMKINNNGSNGLELFGNGTFRRLQVSNAVYMLGGTNLFLDNSILYGGGAPSNNLTLESTSNTTKGFIICNDRINMTDNIIVNCPSLGDGSVSSQINGTNNSSLAVAGSLKFVSQSTSNTSNVQLNMSNNNITNVNNITANLIDGVAPELFYLTDGTRPPLNDWNFGGFSLTSLGGISGIISTSNIQFSGFFTNINASPTTGTINISSDTINLDAGSVVNINTSNLDMNANDILDVANINPVTTGAPLAIGNATDLIELKGSVESDQSMRQYKSLFPASNGTPVISGFYSMITPITNAGTTEVSIFNDTNAQGTRTMPANSLNVGTSFMTSIRGSFTTAGASNITFKAKLNGVTVATSVLTSFNVNPNSNWHVNADWAILTTGVGGSGYGSGLFVADDLGNAVSTSISSSFSIDTTIANTVDFTMQWGAVGDSLTSRIGIIKTNY